MNNHSMPGNFADIEDDYPAHITGTRWSSEYAGDDYFRLFPQMVARLDSAEDSERAKEDRAYLEDWFSMPSVHTTSSTISATGFLRLCTCAKKNRLSPKLPPYGEVQLTNRLQNYGKVNQNKIGDVDFMGLLYDSADIQFKK